MKRLLFSALFLLLSLHGVSAQDMIITKQQDTIHCTLHLPPLSDKRLFYGIEVDGEPETRFMLYRDVSLIYEGTSRRYYYVTSDNKWAEIETKTPRLPPVFKNRIGINGGFQAAKSLGVVPVAQLEYVRYQWRNLGVGVLLNYSQFERDMTISASDGSTFMRTYSRKSFFVGPKVSQRFYVFNSNSFLHLDFAFGYFTAYRNFLNDLRYDPKPYWGFIASAGWEILLSRRTDWAIDFGFNLYPDGWGATLGLKFGR